MPQLNPAQLTSYLKNARTIQALFQICSTNESRLNHIHLSACWNSLGHLARAADPCWFEEHATALESLVQHTIRTFSTADIRARQLANIAHGVARSGRGHSMGALMKALARSIEWRLGDCNAQELANTAWAFAKAGHFDIQLFAALARVAEKRAGDFNAQELANTVCAFATAGYSDAPLFKALAAVVERHLGDFTAQGFANTAGAFAKAGHLDATLFTALARSAEKRLSDLNAQDLATIAFAFAKAGQVDAQLFTALARSAEWHVGDFNAQGLANTVWAFAKAGHVDAQLFTALARSIEKRMGDFNAQDLANTAWAFAKACHLDAQLFTALARSAEKRLGDFNAQDLANTAWAFAKLGQLDVQLFKVLAKSIELRSGDLSVEGLAKIAWAFAKVEQLDAQLSTVLARSAQRRLGEFNAHDLATTAWAFANAGQLDQQLFAALAQSAEQCMGDFNDEDLENTAWAFARAGQQALAKRLKQRNDATPSSVPLAPADVSKCGRIVVAGGGIGGAAVAVALQNKGFDVTVLETDACFDSRKQGYGLTIQRLDAIQALGISLAEDDAPSTSHYTFSAEGHILGVFGEAFREKDDRRTSSDNAGRFIHLPRQALRGRIVDQIRPGTVRWNSKLKEFSCWSDNDQEHDSPGVTVTLTDGTTIDAALLIGSDGIFSTVRRQLHLSGDRLIYMGLIVVLGIVPTAYSDIGSSKEEAVTGGVVCPLAHRRIFETVDGVTRIYAMPFTATSTMWQLSFPYAEEPARMLCKDPAALKDEILQRCGKWHEPVPALLRSTPLDCMAGYLVYDRDPLDPAILRTPQPAAKKTADPQAKPQRRVTLIGDAAHPMSPFRAQGANQALSDAVWLADILEDSVRRHGPQSGLDVALPLFEQKMLSRSKRVMVQSREKAKELHSSLALQAGRKVQREIGIDMPEIIRVLRAKGIGAHSATDPRGLDAVVAEIMHPSGPSVCSSAPTVGKKRRLTEESAATAVAKQKQEVDTEPDPGWWKTLKFDGYTGEQCEAWWTTSTDAEVANPGPAEDHAQQKPRTTLSKSQKKNAKRRRGPRSAEAEERRLSRDIKGVNVPAAAG